MSDDLAWEHDREPEEGIALCLSGGGYRAMMFHLGALIRLHEVGLLSQLARISSVSGGSITAAYLGLKWKSLDWSKRGDPITLKPVVDGIRRMADTTVDAGAIIGGILLPGTISDRVADAYDKTLYQGSSLTELPADGEGPRFVINATNVQSAAVWRFSRPFMGDYRVGLVLDPDIRLAVAVAASSAFPPVLSPVELPIAQAFDPRFDGDLKDLAFRRTVVLSDGGVYDNLGLETAFKRYRTLLVSDGGQKIAPEQDPAHDWARHSMRVLDVIDNQVRSLRKRQLIGAFIERQRSGTYWSIRTNFADYKAPDDPLGCAGRNPRPLADTPTRLQAMPGDLQEKLINWGYAITDTALRVHLGPDLRTRYNVTMTPPKFPYSRGY